MRADYLKGDAVETISVEVAKVAVFQGLGICAQLLSVAFGRHFTVGQYITTIRNR
jgi:hypothetical protein